MTVSGRAVIIGTAGHVDHGKSALVRALTDTDPDRLAEEKARGLTIDLGFAWRSLPGGIIASFVDVPGHEDFIRNMLAGAGAIDAVLFVIAADEGPMPQTREHLAIVDLLGITHGVIALTKVDLVDDEWRQLVVDEVTTLTRGTTIEAAPIVPVSAKQGDGLDDLVAALEPVLASVPAPPDHGRPRLSIDRAFTLSGFGTVVTGTLRDGQLVDGATLELLPDGHTARVRGLQSLGHQVDVAHPGTRAAVNLSGLATDAISRGDVISLPGTYRPSRIIDAWARVLVAAPSPLSHDQPVHVFHGAAESPAHARVIGAAEIAPGSSGAVQLRFERPTVIAAGDRFVLRQPSPSRTLGGGIALDPHPPGRRRRFRAPVLARFEALASRDPEAITWHMLAEREPCGVAALDPADTGLEPPVRDAALSELAAKARVVSLGNLWMTDAGWTGLRARAEAVLRHYHRAHPLRVGAPAEEMRERLELSVEAFGAMLDRATAEGWATRVGTAVRLSGHEVAFSPEQQAAADRLLAAFRAAPFTPPSAREAEDAVGPDVLAAVIARGDLVATGGDVLFDREAYDDLRQGVLDHIDAEGQITVADVRDRFDTSRKYALALLEHLDRQRVTRRVGDMRVRGGPGEDAP